MPRKRFRQSYLAETRLLICTDTDYQRQNVEDKNVCNIMESFHNPGEGGERREKDREILTAAKESSDFLVASYNGDQSKIELLLEGGADGNQQDKSMKASGLMLASFKAQTEVVALLLEKGAHIDMQSNKGYSALMLASLKGHTEVAALLLEKGAHINMQANDGASALVLASSKGHTEVAALLLEKGAHRITMEAQL